MLLETLESLEANPALYRLLIGLIVAAVMNIFGYLGNKVADTSISYDPKKFGELLMVYEPLILLLPEAVPMEYAILGAIAVDITRRLILKLAPAPTES